MSEVIKISNSELIRAPLARSLVTGKSIVVFNIINSAITEQLNTGNKINYQNELYEVMNKESVQSPISYTKFNCRLYPIE